LLYLVATPIGNMSDITLRAIEVLQSVDVIGAEDTRHSIHLLRHHGIQKPLVSYHEHNEAMRTAEFVTRLERGETIALITDAGLPGISDPGHRLLRACIERSLPYTIIPGPSAVPTALLGSGFDADRFYFGGFLPTKSGQRERELTAAIGRTETTIFFESPYRLIKSLELLHTLAPDRLVCVARELTKKFEEFRRGTPGQLATHYGEHPPKGEITLVISGTA
jgi:16S rRNA (cytidine1402-2'-O)-methyltransferase